MSSLVIELFPAPGGPVIPIRTDWLVLLKNLSKETLLISALFSISVIKRDKSR